MTIDGPRRPAEGPPATGEPELVWYASYGSNMHASRLGYYLRGGRPPHGARTYPGCRDSSPPRERVPVLLPGRLYFALESMAWTGGLALYDPLDEGETPARAYLVTAAQFSDITAQEMYRPPGADLPLGEALARGRAVLGPGRYETLICPGWLDGHPVLTFTASWRSRDVEWNSPSATYLRHLALGLVETHGWSPVRAAGYLSERPGALGAWTASRILDVIDSGDPPPAD